MLALALVALGATHGTAACGSQRAAAPAFAHASLESTDPSSGAIVPTSPPQIDLKFSESVSVGLGGVRVLAASGGEVSTGKPATVPGQPSVVRTTLPTLKKGTYVVTWRVAIRCDMYTTLDMTAFPWDRQTLGERACLPGKGGMETGGWYCLYVRPAISPPRFHFFTLRLPLHRQHL